MKIMFDSNVWRIVSTPSKFPKEKSINDFQKIREAIVAGKIDPYISETAFTIEAIKKVHRKAAIAKKKLRIETETTEKDGGVSLFITIGPSAGSKFDLNPILKNHFEDAVKLGFKIVRLPRIGSFFNIDVDKNRYILPPSELEGYQKKVFDIAGQIESYNAGFAHLKSIAANYGNGLTDGMSKAPASEEQNIIKAVAEWADGDSVAISIALACDYFCTRDKAKKGGVNSVLSTSNIAWLKREHDFKVISPEDLARLV